MKNNSIFDQIYWEKNYDEPETMDGIFNAKDHAQYLKSFFAIYLVDINSIMDLGAGQGQMFSQLIRLFKPYQAVAIEPSPIARKILIKRIKKLTYTGKIKILSSDLEHWSQEVLKNPKAQAFDLGICCSVLQYIDSKNLDQILSAMSYKFKYLYLSVPTDIEAQRMKDESDFSDPWAKHRTRDFYLQLIKKHFTIIGKGILESKVHFKEEDTLLSELLYRF